MSSSRTPQADPSAQRRVTPAVERVMEWHRQNRGKARAAAEPHRFSESGPAAQGASERLKERTSGE